MRELTNDWLEKMNDEFRKNNVSHKQRPFLAWTEWTKYIGASTEFGDENVKRIFAWFKENSPSGAHQIGSFYTGVFYFDAHLWPVEIPWVYGTVELQAFNSIKGMPDNMKLRLQSDQHAAADFAAVWGDCVDYSFGIERLISVDNNTLWQDLLRSGHQQLQSTVALLQGNKPNPKAVEPARMATEMFLKAFITHKTGMTDIEARKQIGHSLEKALNKCLEIDPESELIAIRSALSSFPEIAERYRETDTTLWELWRMYGMAQYSGTSVVRALSGHDLRKQGLS
jgi:hypothetical protein